MGGSQSKKKFKSQSTKVNIFLDQARQEIQKGNVEKVQEFYEKAINASESYEDKGSWKGGLNILRQNSLLVTKRDVDGNSSNKFMHN